MLLEKDYFRVILGGFVGGLAAGYACSYYDNLAVVDGMFQGAVSSLRTLFVA